MRFAVSSLLSLLLVFSCKEKAPVSPSKPSKPASPAAASRRTTAPQIAINNLNYQLERSRVLAQRLPKKRSEVVALLLVKTQLLGQLDALDEALKYVPNTSALEKPTAQDYLEQAKVQGARHLFAEALESLKKAQSLGAKKTAREEATLKIAQGKAAAVLPKLLANAKANPDFSNLSQLGLALAALGKFQRADEAFVKAFEAYQDVSPFPLAWLQFRRGVMWSERAGNAQKGKQLYQQALQYLPDYVVANVHLAEIEAETGQIDAAIARLQAILPKTNDPEPMGLLGELHIQKGDKEKGEALIKKAQTRYTELLKKHRAAFADHAAEFFLGPGAAPKRALELARENLEHRTNERALALAIRAALAAGQEAEACGYIRRAQGMKTTGVELPELVERPCAKG